MLTLITSFVTLPTGDNLVASTTEYSAPFFTAWLPIVWFIVGVSIAAIVASGIISWIINAFKNFTGRDKYE